MHIPGYQIERELGQGGMALVYLAMQESLDRHVALKIIKPVLTADADFAPRFLREGRIIAQLNDTHIVTVYDIGSHDGVYYLSMEYLPGGTLHQRIRDGLPLHDALSVTRAIASALHYAHRRNIIHRDIKPQNILFRENGSPVLTDFGIAKTLGGSTIMTRTGLSIGTPRYMSPEQIRGQAVDGRADLYSLGVLFYEMMAGDVPFAAEDSFALAMMHVTAPIPELPAELARFQPFLSKLLEKDPANRFQDGEEVIAALDAIEPPTGYTGIRPALLLNRSGPSTAPGQRPRWQRTLPLAAAFAGVVAAGGYALLNRATSPDAPSTVAPPVATSTSVDTPVRQQAEADQLLAQATQHQAAGAFTESLARIDQGLRLVPEHAGLLALRQQVSNQLAATDKTQPGQESAQPVKPDAEAFLTEARRARQDGALDSSLAHLERGLLALPQHSDLLALKREVQEQQARQRSQQELEARQQALAAEQRKLEAARLRAQAEQQRQLEAQLRAQIEEQRQAEARLRAQAEELQRKAEQERRRAQIEEQRRVEAQRRAEAEAERQAEQERRRAEVTEAAPTEQERRAEEQQRRAEQEQRRAEAQRRTEAEAEKRQAEVEAKERRRQAEIEAKERRQAEAEAEAQHRAEQERLRTQAEEQRRLEARLRAQAEEQKRAEERLQAQAKEQQRAEERLQAQAEEQQRRAEERARAQAEKQRRAEAQAQQQLEEQQASRAAAQESPPRRTAPAAESESDLPAISLVSPAQLATQPKPSSSSRPAAVDSTLRDPPAAPESALPTAQQAWATVKNSTNPSEIEQFIENYPKQRKLIAAAHARLKQLQATPSLLVRLVVRANQAGSEVLINGKPAGATPLETELPTGAYHLQVQREGYEEWSKEVTLTAEDEVVKLTVPLLRKRAESAALAESAPDTPPTRASTKPRSPEVNAQPEIEAAPPRRGRPAETQTAAEPPPTQTASSAQTNCLQGNCQNGSGTYRHPDGSEYSGDFRNAKMHGQGTYTYAKRGEKYAGEWRNNVIHGQGTYYYRTGNRYDGEWRNGRKAGQGTYLYANGEKYVGDFADDQPSGQGVYYYQDGSRYEGEWRNGRKNGQGVLYENGKRIVGEWQDDRKIRISVEQ